MAWVILIASGVLEAVWATALGYLLFGDLPDRWTVVGGLMLAGSGLYVLYRERKLRGDATPPTAGRRPSASGPP